MKKLSFLLMMIMAGLVVFQSCKDEEEDTTDDNTQTSILPTSMTLDVPASISSSGSTKSLLAVDKKDFQGDDVYEYQRVFIWVAEASATIVDELMTVIGYHGLSRPMTVSFTSEDDGREKTFTVTENASFGGKSYAYLLNMTDQDGGTAMQIFWNQSPVSGVAIINPYNLDRTENPTNEEGMLQIEYTETDATYDATMIVSIVGAFEEDDNDDFAVNNMKMFVGKKGDIFDLYGASNHPKAKLSTDSTVQAGISWAFTARADDQNDVAVCEVALPQNTVSSVSGLFTDYSINKVFTDLYTSIYQPVVDLGWWTEEQLQDTIAYHLENTEAPAYFQEGEGFIGNGSTLPSVTGFTSEFVDLSALRSSVYAPADVAALEIKFQEVEATAK